MDSMFTSSLFNQDISKWDVSKVQIMEDIFNNSKFNHDLFEWQPYKLESARGAFNDCIAPIPYWAEFDNLKDRIRAINSFQEKKELKKELNIELKGKQIEQKKLKI
jgi:CRISPR/Cas system CMR-associated protein Cmr1 (group 7 of RAMP superfamily)